METFIWDLEVFLGCFRLWCDGISSNPEVSVQSLEHLASAIGSGMVPRVTSWGSSFPGSVGWSPKFIRKTYIPKINDPKKVGFQMIFYFHLYLGKDSHFEEHIFQIWGETQPPTIDKLYHFLPEKGLLFLGLLLSSASRGIRAPKMAWSIIQVWGFIHFIIDCPR